MKLKAVCALLICLVAFFNLTYVLGKEVIKPRIVNGELANYNQFKYQAGLVISGNTREQFCGGTLIHNEWVLTAAHCITISNAREVTVYLGGINKFKGPVQYTVKRNDIIVHEKYDKTKTSNDIALIKIPFVRNTEAIQPIALPKIGSTVYWGADAIASGWGRTFVGQTAETVLLHYGDFKIISNADCLKSYSSKDVNDGIVCATSTNGTSVCNGDSGGPLVLKSPNVLVGISIFIADEGCGSKKPNGFTRVTYYRDWIRSKTGLKL